MRRISSNAKPTPAEPSARLLDVAEERRLPDKGSLSQAAQADAATAESDLTLHQEEEVVTLWWCCVTVL